MFFNSKGNHRSRNRTSLRRTHAEVGQTCRRAGSQNIGFFSNYWIKTRPLQSPRAREQRGEEPCTFGASLLPAALCAFSHPLVAPSPLTQVTATEVASARQLPSGHGDASVSKTIDPPPHGDEGLLRKLAGTNSHVHKIVSVGDRHSKEKKTGGRQSD